MAVFIVDASVALAWCFEDERSTLADGLLERVRRGDQIVVPAHWPTEILNGLLVAERRKHRARSTWRSAKSTALLFTTPRTWNWRSAAAFLWARWTGSYTRLRNARA